MQKQETRKAANTFGKSLYVTSAMSGQDSPVSWIRRCSSPGWRKASSLHERICVPTRSELVASILALSSFRFTPAIEATSLISSSSLKDEMVDGKKNTHFIVVHFYNTFLSCNKTNRNTSPSFTSGKVCEISTPLQGKTWEALVTVLLTPTGSCVQNISSSF